MTVVIDLPFASLDDLPGALRTSACAVPVVTISINAELALRLARVIEREAMARAERAAIAVEYHDDAAVADSLWSTLDRLSWAAIGRVVFGLFVSASAVGAWAALAVWWLS